MKRLDIQRAASSLFDNFGRIHDYLRISLTEKCNLRCKYCMPAEGVSLSKRDQLLSGEELRRLSGIFVKSCGINKIRLTGGEPTVEHKRLVQLMENLHSLRSHGLNYVAMTTNGLTLKRKVALYKDLGKPRSKEIPILFWQKSIDLR